MVTRREPTVSIGEAARQAGSTPRALRYYEQQGLLLPERTTGGQRRYTADMVERVQLYRRLLGAGLGTDVIRELMPCMNGGASSATIAILRRELAAIRAQAGELEATAAKLEQILVSLRPAAAAVS